MILDTQTCGCVRGDLDNLCRIFNLDNIDLSPISCGDAGSFIGDTCK
jgi:hypothetical protein